MSAQQQAKNKTILEPMDSGSEIEEITSQLHDAQNAILVLKQIIDDKTFSLQKEREVFEEIRKKLDGVHFNKHIKLNVGGQIFKTSIETLVKDPDSMLAAMFSQRFDVKPDEDGAYFIDRDGTHFRYILNYLRNGKLNVNLKENKALEVYAEAEFYQITGLKKEIWPGPGFEGSSHLISSLSGEQMDALLSWLPPTPSLHNWIQCYSGVMDGWSSAGFHKKCDERGPTLIIARVGRSNFGGYAHASWNTSDGFVKDKESFLFLLSNSSGAPPTKLPSNNGGIWSSANYGLAFGNSSSRKIRLIYDGASNGCSIGSGTSGGFKVPQDAALHTFLGIGETVTMNYLEVFSLEKCNCF